MRKLSKITILVALFIACEGNKPMGEHLVAGERVVISSPIYLESGDDFVCQDGQVLTIPDGAHHSIFKVVGVTDVTIRNCKLDGNRVGTPMIRDRNSTHYAIEVRDAIGVSIKNTEITEWPFRAIHVFRSEDVIVEDNTIENTPQGVYFRQVKGGEIANNVVSDYLIFGINTEDHNEQVTVSGNDIETEVEEGTPWVADCLSGYGAGNRHMLAIGNICKGAPNHGIHWAGDYILVAMNTFINSATHGIFLNASSHPGVVNVCNSIFSNIVIGSKDGIRVERVDDLFIAYNIIKKANREMYFDPLTFFTDIPCHRKGK